MTPLIGLVVPALENGGGVASVARFVDAAAERSGRYRIRPVSLATSSRDACSTRLLSPRTWRLGVREQRGTWQGKEMVHVGAELAELEFQRYRPRRALADALKGCALVQVVCGSPAWAVAVRGVGVPVSLQVATRARVERRRRNSAPRTPADWWRRAMTEITDGLDDLGLRSVDAIQVENPWMLAYARSVNARRQGVDIRYAPPGVDHHLFRPIESRLPGANPYVLCVGRLDDPRKNIGLLLEAFLRLPAELGNVRLVTAGAGAPPPAYWDRVRSAGVGERVRHVARPALPELVELYQNASAFALASDEEGLGVVLLEAMACGVPVVSTRSGGPEGIITDGVEGYLVDLDDADALRDRLERLLRSESHNLALGRNARRTIEARYSAEVTGSAFVEVWDELLGAR